MSELDHRRLALNAVEHWLNGVHANPDDTYPALSVDEAFALLETEWHDRERILTLASRVRDYGLVRAHRPRIITYSKKAFLPITNLCRDRCHYCTFVETPKQLERQNKSLFMTPERILAVAKQAAALGCKEALFTLGDRPEDRWPEAKAWLQEHGHKTTLEYVGAMAEMVLNETGMLPHLNPGVMSYEEMLQLRSVAPSMGMMLETTSVRLWAEQGQAHYGSPDKEPAVRLQVLDDAGRARIPFTTGILVGIGETVLDRAESLLAIRESHHRFGHIQEVIVQNFRAKPDTAMQSTPDLETAEYLTTIAVARLVLGPDVRVQVPPNLADQRELELLLSAGADDWGGVSPLTADHVNPERPWPNIEQLAARTSGAGFSLHERLTAHPPYIREAATWIDPKVLPAVAQLTDNETYLADEHARVAGLSRNAQSATGPVRDTSHIAPAVLSSMDALLLRAANAPTELSEHDYATLLGAEGADLETLCELADDLRRYSVGEALGYVRNRTLDLNGFGHPAGYDIADLAAIADDAVDHSLTELCIQAIVPKKLSQRERERDLVAIARGIKQAHPGLHLHAFRPAEVVARASQLRISVDELIVQLAEAGVSTIPGTGVKVLNEEFRAANFRDDLDVQSWLDTVRSAHVQGIRSTSVVGYGYGETLAHRIEHLASLLRLQEETGGFTECVLLPSPSFETRQRLTGAPALNEHRAMHAITRLMLNGRISNVQVAWPRHDLDTAVSLLRSGANDLGGTLTDGSVFAQFSAEPGRELNADMLSSLAKRLSRPLRQRDTSYADASANAELVNS